MPTIYIRTPLSENNILALQQEFPYYQLVFHCDSEKDWELVEILFGDQLSLQELEYAKQLKWIHCTSPQVEKIPIEAIHEKREIFVTISKGGNVTQISEFVIGAILAFAKHFFLWPKVSRASEEFWDWPLKDTIWSLKDRILLQIGLGEIGTSVVKTCSELGMKTWGVQIQRTFHPYCKKTQVTPVRLVMTSSAM